MKKLVWFFLVGIKLFALDLNIGFSASEAYKRVDKIREHQQEVYGINLELTHKFLVSELGIGVAYEGDYKYKDESFGALPVYGLVKFNLSKKKISPYVVGKYGKTIFLTDSVKGLDFFSVGVGVKIHDKIHLELTHEVKVINNSRDCFGKNSVAIRYNIM